MSFLFDIAHRLVVENMDIPTLEGKIAALFAKQKKAALEDDIELVETYSKLISTYKKQLADLLSNNTEHGVQKTEGNPTVKPHEHALQPESIVLKPPVDQKPATHALLPIPLSGGSLLPPPTSRELHSAHNFSPNVRVGSAATASPTAPRSREERKRPRDQDFVDHHPRERTSMSSLQTSERTTRHGDRDLHRSSDRLPNLRGKVLTPSEAKKLAPRGYSEEYAEKLNYDRESWNALSSAEIKTVRTLQEKVGLWAQLRDMLSKVPSGYVAVGNNISYEKEVFSAFHPSQRHAITAVQRFLRTQELNAEAVAKAAPKAASNSAGDQKTSSAPSSHNPSNTTKTEGTQENAKTEAKDDATKKPTKSDIVFVPKPDKSHERYPYLLTVQSRRGELLVPSAQRFPPSALIIVKRITGEILAVVTDIEASSKDEQLADEDVALRCAVADDIHTFRKRNQESAEAKATLSAALAKVKPGVSVVDAEFDLQRTVLSVLVNSGTPLTWEDVPKEVVQELDCAIALHRVELKDAIKPLDVVGLGALISGSADEDGDATDEI